MKEYLDKVAKCYQHFRYLWREMTGEGAYDAYLARHSRDHPDHEPMSERDFWRARADEAENNVQARCC
ncbi:YbdD/YjiX family protein [Arcanobacterium pinnipediorum]|uniref:YbdD/YjiX family protein n=1 Tax=Arcanobacterium pinnipediorum TaxID=1503041 RepID=A0ABY5AKP6_9ACTO|nr:YbdD/YjiX family protein [Arcanobacterium pinnipediorum]USR79829.1 YbdD/YjiX family protein [Arcanobacterium pinnipediorum]